MQTLSRLNRIHAGKEDTFVLDFVNEAEEIREAFKPFYEVPAVDQQVEPGQLYALQHTLAEQQVYYPNEVEEFAKVFFKPKQSQTPNDHAMMHKHPERAGGAVRGAGGGEAGTLPEATHCVSPVVLVHVADHPVSGRRSWRSCMPLSAC